MARLLTIISFSFFFCLNILAQERYWSFEINGGIPYNFPSPLVIKQEGEPTIRLTARYRSEPFVSPGYYLLRGGRWNDGKAWEIEFVHHKLYLDNMPPEVQEFSISHGYNIFTVNRASEKLLFKDFNYILRLGAGVVISHPETTIRGLSLEQEGGTLGGGYYITGPVLNIAMAKRLYFLDPLFINLELKFNPSVSWIPIEGGQAIVWNFPVTFAFGMGVDLFNSDKRNKKSLPKEAFAN